MRRQRGDGATAPGRVTVRVPAKVNLFLAVRGLRPDGYHELVTVLETVSLHDAVSAELVGGHAAGQHPSARAQMGIACSHDADPSLPRDERNLAVRAALLLAERAGIQAHVLPEVPAEADGPATVLHLEKSIPLAGGMAGGSADAAGALIGLDRLWDCGLDREELGEIGAEVGADVPFCLTGGTALATGTGTATAQILSPGSHDWVVVPAEQGLPVAEVYGTWDRIGTPSEIGPDAVLEALRTRDTVALGAALHNDLEEAAITRRPELGDVRDRLFEAGALGAVVSGSGPTVVGLAADVVSAARIAAELEADGHRSFVVRGPAGGPEITRIG